MCSASAATPYFVTPQQCIVFIHGKLSIPHDYILHSQLWGQTVAKVKRIMADASVRTQ